MRLLLLCLLGAGLILALWAWRPQVPPVPAREPAWPAQEPAARPGTVGLPPEPPVPEPSQVTTDFEPLELRLVAASSGRVFAPGATIETTRGVRVELHAVLLAHKPAPSGRGETFLIGASSVVGKARFGAHPRRDWGGPETANLSWYKVHPEGYGFSNWAGPTFAFTRVLYSATWVAVATACLRADPRSPNRLQPDDFGTMRFQVAYDDGSHRVRTPGVEQMVPTRRPAGLCTVSFALDTGVPLLDRASLLGNVPYIYGAETATRNQADHPAEWFYGSDCADMVFFGLRRLGRNLPYGFTGSFEPSARLTRLVAAPKLSGDVYVDANGMPLRWGTGGVQAGDLILWPRSPAHIGILVGEEGARRGGLLPESAAGGLNTGLLDAADLVFHHLGMPPRFSALGRAYSPPFRVLRVR